MYTENLDLLYRLGHSFCTLGDQGSSPFRKRRSLSPMCFGISMSGALSLIIAHRLDECTKKLFGNRGINFDGDAIRCKLSDRTTRVNRAIRANRVVCVGFEKKNWRGDCRNG